MVKITANNTNMHGIISKTFFKVPFFVNFGCKRPPPIFYTPPIFDNLRMIRTDKILIKILFLIINFDAEGQNLPWLTLR